MMSVQPKAPGAWITLQEGPRSLKTFLIAAIFWLGGLSSSGTVTAAETATARALGQITIESTAGCETQQCYKFSVVCPEVAAAEQGTLTVGEPLGQPLRGTVLLMTGGPGTTLFQTPPESHRLVQELRSAGFRTVQLQWSNGWLWGTAGRLEGHVRLACRPATVARWVYDELMKNDGSARVFCATGNSGGAAQCSYMLTHYGLETIFSTVIITGGPPMGRMDLSCLREDTTRELWFPDWAAQIIDGGFGFPRDGTGPCARADGTYREMFLNASVASGEGDYHYPKTLVWFVFGGSDGTGATAQGLTYCDLLLKNNSPLVRKDTLPGVRHNIAHTREGTAKIRDILLSEDFKWVNRLPASHNPGLRHGIFHSTLMDVEVGYVIYLPPGYEHPDQAHRRYPVVYFLHGGKEGSEIKDIGMAEEFDRRIRAGVVAPRIYVFVNGGKWSHYDHEGSLGESAFVRELIPHIDRCYRTVANRTGRGIEGFSAGGRGTARIFLKHPEVFCSAVPMGGGHQHEKHAAEHQGEVRLGQATTRLERADDNTWDLARQFARLENPPRAGILVVVGTRDFNYQANLDWMNHLRTLNIPFESLIVPEARHTPVEVYKKVGDEIMRFHERCFAAAGSRTDR